MPSPWQAVYKDQGVFSSQFWRLTTRLQGQLGCGTQLMGQQHWEQGQVQGRESLRRDRELEGTRVGRTVEQLDAGELKCPGGCLSPSSSSGPGTSQWASVPAGPTQLRTKSPTQAPLGENPHQNHSRALLRPCSRPREEFLIPPLFWAGMSGYCTDSSRRSLGSVGPRQLQT